MKILFFNPATTQTRFVAFEAIKGSPFFRRPNYTAMQLSYLSRSHKFYYYDERIEERPKFSPDIIIINIPLNLARYVERYVKEFKFNDLKVVSCGIFPTVFPERAKLFSDIVVVGDIAAVWREILADIKSKSEKEIYRSENHPSFKIDREIELKYGFTPLYSQLRTNFGCGCLGQHKDYCFENVLYIQPTHWNIGAVKLEVLRIKRKVIFILDDDFLMDIDYAVNILEKCWAYKKMWIFQTTRNIFQHPDILPVLRDCGVRIVYLKEDWLDLNLCEHLQSLSFLREKGHEVAMLHNCRIAVGAKVRLGFEAEDYNFYRRLCKFFLKIKVDFLEIAVQTPIPNTPTYKKYHKQGQIIEDLTLYDEWMPVVRIPGVAPQALYSWMEQLRDHFYSWNSIVRRNFITSSKLGFYNTIFFHLIPNLSYRTNFLEKVGYPP